MPRPVLLKMLLWRMVLPVLSLPSSSTPAPPLKAMTLPTAAVGPPITLLAASRRWTPLPPLPSARVPETSVPMWLLCTTLAVVPRPCMRTP